MSLHIKLSPEAQARLAKQQRQSSLLSIAIAILVCVLLALIMTLVAIKIVAPPEVRLIEITNTQSETSDLDTEVPPIERHDLPTPSFDKPNLIGADIASAITVPIIDTPSTFQDSITEFETDNEFGEFDQSFEEGTVDVQTIVLPSGIRKRCDVANRLQRLRDGGAGAKAEMAEKVVTNALTYLQETQNEDGSWTQSKYPVAMTGLSLLAYLGHCDTPKSREYGSTVLNAISYLVKVAIENDGYIVSDKDEKHLVYEHAIATYALAEALSFKKASNYNMPELEQVVQKAGQLIIDKQHESGSWNYSYKTEGKHTGDNSVGGWQIQALKACEHTKLDFKGMKSTIKRAHKFLKSCQNNDGALGYRGQPGEKPIQNQAMTAVGALSFQIWNKSDDSLVRKATKFLHENSTFDYNSPSCDLYGQYYTTQVMLNAGGDYWKRYNEQFLSSIIDAQSPDGSFKKVNNGGNVEAVAASWQHDKALGKHYRTCLSTLMIETYYRFLPATEKK